MRPLLTIKKRLDWVSLPQERLSIEAWSGLRALRLEQEASALGVTWTKVLRKLNLQFRIVNYLIHLLLADLPNDAQYHSLLTMTKRLIPCEALLVVLFLAGVPIEHRINL